MASVAQIKIWDKTAGAVVFNEATGIGTFEYQENFLNTKWDLSPIKMPLSRAKNTVFSFPNLAGNNTFKGMPGLLADVLPDKYGNALINTWLAANGRLSNSLNPVEILCFIGKRGMGALEFEPVTPKYTNATNKLSIDSLVQVAQDILWNKKKFLTNLSVNEERAITEILKIGTSAGGARAKAIIACNPITKEVRSGQTIAPEGFSHWLIKFDGVDDDQFGSSKGYGRVEMAYHLMAKDCEIDMMECRLLVENDRAHFMTKRFDRPSEKEKLHVQTFCAMQHYNFNDVGLYSYEQLFETMRILKLPYIQAEQLFRRMVFNVVARNCDDHTKNFAFIMNKENEWKLSPAYDVCHAYRPGSAWVSQQSLSVNGERIHISTNHLLAVAKNMNIKKAKNIITQITSVIKNWSNYADEVGVQPLLRDSIYATLLV